MIKGLIIQQQHPVVEENMSNLTSASGEASVSSSNHGETGTMYPKTPLMKKKRNLAGNPDPDAEVIALSPRTLMATNRFVCEICNKGFQRDQNLQLHRRGHNLPWKLKQRTSKEIRKRVYVCPEITCIHHDPSRALGDLTGIKKHFFRKHGEKRWKCDKCSKRYAVQSDWKAHSKTCGTREYRCDCGTLFSRRDSFITHRAFCDALAEESARAITAQNPLLSSQPSTSTILNLPQFNSHELQSLSLKKEEHYFNPTPEIPPWLPYPSIFSTRIDQDFSNSQESIHHENPNSSSSCSLPPYNPSASPHMSATALLQKAAQMGSTMSQPSSSPALLRPHHAHMFANTGKTGFSLGLSSYEEKLSGFVPGLTTFGNKAAISSHLMDHISVTATTVGSEASSKLQNIMSSLSSPASGFDSSSFENVFNGVLNSKRDENLLRTTITHLGENDESGGGNDGMTRDFLGLRAFSHTDLLNLASFDQQYQSQNQKPWQG